VLGEKMKSFALITPLLLLCGCSSEKERFDRDMQHRYEVQCANYYSIYDSGDIGSAKQALADIIQLSVSERDKARFYWRFNLVAAFSEARLAVIAEMEGNQEEAGRLFARASDYMALQKKMLREHLQEMPGVNWGESATNAAEVPTPDEWRDAIAKLDAASHVRWKSPNQTVQRTGASRSALETNSTSSAAGSRR
jgi:hypothetical protein